MQKPISHFAQFTVRILGEFDALLYCLLSTTTTRRTTMASVDRSRIAHNLWCDFRVILLLGSLNACCTLVQNQSLRLLHAKRLLTTLFRMLSSKSVLFSSFRVAYLTHKIRFALQEVAPESNTSSGTLLVSLASLVLCMGPQRMGTASVTNHHLTL